MTEAAIEELRLREAAAMVENLVGEQPRRRDAEALARSLWTHRKGLIDAAEAVPALVEALRPFARAALLMPDGYNPVLLSLPSPADGGRTFVQLRGADFHRAARAWRDHAS